MKSILAYGVSGTYPLQVKEATLKRRYEEGEYAFIAADLKLECADAQNLYDTVVTGEVVSAVVKDGDMPRFRGTIQSDGAAYDPEHEFWSFSAVHRAKAIFETLKQRREWRPGEDNRVYSFDDLSTFALRGDWFCNMETNESAFEFLGKMRWAEPYLNYLKNNPDYSTRDYLIDIAKHVRGVLHVDDGIPPVVRLTPRQSAAASIGSFDDLIAEYSEEQQDAEFNAVFFPCMINGLVSFALYSHDDVEIYIPDYYRTPLDRLSIWRTVHFLSVGQSFNLPDRTLDLRVPRGAYSDGMPDYFPFPCLSVPNFRAETYYWLQETPLEYCERHFKHLTGRSRKLNVLYRNPVTADPTQRITVRSKTAVISEVEDDLVNETTRIIGRVAA